MIERTIEHLRALVACDTQNPPRAIDSRHPIFDYLGSVLGGFEIEVTDYGDGHVNFHATRGKPEYLFNVHIDTVPNGKGWRSDPLELRVEDGRAYGRGTCDIKGAVAAQLAIAEATEAPMALLYSSDEEGAGGCCVRNFCETVSPADYAGVIVAEPTQCRAVSAHRGYLSVIGRFSGVAGHSSEPRAMTDNAIHRFSRWAAAAVNELEGETGTQRSCFNIGTVNGGVKSNVIANDLEVRWSARLAGGQSNDAFLERITALAPQDQAGWEVPFSGPPLPAPGDDGSGARNLISRFGLEAGDPVDFWTEASLFSAAGFATIVLGSGDIAQAHAVDEWVAVDELERIGQIYRRILEDA